MQDAGFFLMDEVVWAKEVVMVDGTTIGHCMVETSLEGRNLANVWYIGNSRKGENHHAAFPTELIEPPVAMTCPECLVSDGGEVKARKRIIEHIVYSERARKFITVYGQLSAWRELHPDESTLTDEKSQGWKPSGINRGEMIVPGSTFRDTSRP
jgi:hypothetical protein